LNEEHALMHQTLKKFGYPATLLKDFEHWSVVLRPAQVTLGALVLIAKSDARSIAELPLEAFAELHSCCTTIDRALRHFNAFDKLNYLALMMVDPQVHFHVLPRYATPQSFDGVTFDDPAWPGPPDLKAVNEISDSTKAALHQALARAFANTM
jgi:diadenosine tetraphosphate (Ap4A) HIT family hydrolase